MTAFSGKSWRKILAVALMSSLPATAWVLSREQAAAGPAKERTEAKIAPTAAGGPADSVKEDLGLVPIGREAKPAQGKVADVFGRQSWDVESPPEASPPPKAPPMPFAYMGKVVEDGKETVFLTRQDKSYAAKVGETLDGVYRVEKIQPSMVTFTYLPLHQRQQLATGE